MKKLRKDSRGFTIIELITAIGIVAVLGVSVGLFMSTSSKTYSKLSVEAQLQSEAQMVANMINELAIDSYDAKSKLTEDYGYIKDEGKILVLNSKVDGGEKKYIIGRKATDNELYLKECSYNMSLGAWTVAEEALLGNYITDFNVDTSRVEQENMLRFTLSYEKDGRTYSGNYQVLMRNRAYADKDTTETEVDEKATLAIQIDPKVVYIDIKKNQATHYYFDTTEDSNKRTATASGIAFNARAISNQDSVNNEVVWSLRNANANIFEMSVAEGETSELVWANASEAFDNQTSDSLTVVINKTITLPSGVVVKANAKTANVMLRRIKNINLYALSGATQWSNQYSDLPAAVSSPDANGYVYKGADGKYLPLNLNASITSSYIAFGGGLNWELYMLDANGNWQVCDNSAFAALNTKSTPTGTSNTVIMGGAAANGQLYKVVATSMFDDSYFAEYVFGVAPTVPTGDGGYNSRGFYTNMSSYMDGHKPQSDKQAVSQLLYLNVSSIDGSANIGDWKDKVKIIRDASGTWRLFVNYDAFSYSGPQKADFYGGNILIHLVYAYYGADGKIYVSGKGSANFVDDIVATLGIKKEDIAEINDIDLQYKLNPVVVSKISPVNDVVVLDKGSDKSFYVKTAYYNLLSPRNGNYYFGVYIDDLHNNLVQPGKADINPYFKVEMTSAYGDTNNYVEEASVNLTAKSKTSQKKYLTDPATFRLAANDFYLISTSSPDSRSYTDYKVLLSNVEGASVYIPGPKSTYSGLSWPAGADSGTATDVVGLSTAGANVSAKVYKSNNKCYLEYGGKKYVYNMTYNYWQK